MAKYVSFSCLTLLMQEIHPLKSDETCLLVHSTFQYLTVLSILHDTMSLSSWQNPTVKMSFVCHLKITLVLNAFRSQSLTVLSQEPEMTYFEFFVIANEDTKWLCPLRDLNGLQMTFSCSFCLFPLSLTSSGASR